MRIKLFFIIFSIIFFCGCDADSKLTVELRKNIANMKNKIKQVQQNTQSLEVELQETWKSSLLYRFPQVKNIDWTGETQGDFENLDHYLTTINFISLKKNKLQVVFNYKTDKKKIQPHFYVYIFDSRGINIHKEEIKYKKYGFNATLKVETLVPDKRTLKLPKGISGPTYFLLKEVIK